MRQTEPTTRRCCYPASRCCFTATTALALPQLRHNRRAGMTARYQPIGLPDRLFHRPGRRHLLALMAAGSAMLMSACGGTDGASPGSTTPVDGGTLRIDGPADARSEEHTSELQSRGHLV